MNDHQECSAFRASSALQKRLIFTGRSEMQLHFVYEQIDRNPVIQRNSYHRGRREDLYFFFLDRNIQVLGFLEDSFADLVFGVAIYHPKPGLLLHFVSELIFIDIRRKKLESRKDAKNENCGEGNRFDSASATLCAPRPLISADLQDQNASQCRPETYMASGIWRNFSYFYANTGSDRVSSASVGTCSERATPLWSHATPKL